MTDARAHMQPGYHAAVVAEVLVTLSVRGYRRRRTGRGIEADDGEGHAAGITNLDRVIIASDAMGVPADIAAADIVRQLINDIRSH